MSGSDSSRMMASIYFILPTSNKCEGVKELITRLTIFAAKNAAIYNSSTNCAPQNKRQPALLVNDPLPLTDIRGAMVITSTSRSSIIFITTNVLLLIFAASLIETKLKTGSKNQVNDIPTSSVASFSETGESENRIPTVEEIKKVQASLNSAKESPPSYCYIESAACSILPAECLLCNFNTSCVYGEVVNVTCKPKPDLDCKVIL